MGILFDSESAKQAVKIRIAGHTTGRAENLRETYLSWIDAKHIQRFVRISLLESWTE